MGWEARRLRYGLEGLGAWKDAATGGLFCYSTADGLFFVGCFLSSCMK
jgi:hypothetical protein